MTTCVISYYNMAAYGSIENNGGASFETEAPLSNLLTPRLGQKAIQVGESPNAEFIVYIKPGSPTYSAFANVFATLGHNIIESYDASDVIIEATFDDGSSVSSAGDLDAGNFVNASPDGAFQSHIVWAPTNTVFLTKRVVSVRFVIYNASLTMRTGSIDPYTGQITSAPLSIGGIWIGRKFAPRNGILLDGFKQSVVDNSQVVRSIGGQVWSEPEIRQRTAEISFGGLYENEVYDVAPSMSLQQMAAYCGISRPLLVIPTISSEQLAYAQTVYGYMPEPPSWGSFEKAGLDGVQTRVYQGSFNIVEAR